MPRRPRSRFPSALALLLVGCPIVACQAGVSRREIGDQAAAALRPALPEATIERVDELTLRVVAPDGRKADVRLDNVFTLARNDPGQTEPAMRALVASVVEAMSRPTTALDPTRIVPVVRERTFVQAVASEMAGGGDAGKPTPVPVWEPLGGSLVVTYVEDLDDGMRYLDEDALAAAGVDRATLRILACGNLRRILPATLEIEDLDRAYLVTADGAYESSLLLLDELWTGERFAVAGDFVVAVPARDILLVTGSEERRGLAKVRRSAIIASRRGDHPISKALFRRMPDGALVPFVDPDA